MTELWVTLELSRMGEKERPEDLHDLLLAEFPDKDVEIFIPAQSFFRRDNAVTVCVLEGYAFIKAGHPAAFYFEFENSPYVSKVLSRDEKEGRYLQYVHQDSIDSLRSKLQVQSIREIKVGDAVTIHEGVYSNMTGVVQGLNSNGEDAYVSIDGLVSLETFVVLPLQFLKKN